MLEFQTGALFIRFHEIRDHNFIGSAHGGPGLMRPVLTVSKFNEYTYVNYNWEIQVSFGVRNISKLVFVSEELLNKKKHKVLLIVF